MRTTSALQNGGRPSARAWAGLILAVLGVSGTSTYMKLAGTDPLVTAFWRLAVSTVLLLPLQIWRGRARPTVPGLQSSHGAWTPASAEKHPSYWENILGRETAKKHLLVSTPVSPAQAGIHPAPAAGMLQRLRLSPVTLLAGALLAVHFALWVTSLSMTSVLSSLVFVAMNPLFVAVLDLLLFRERTSSLLWAAVAVVTGGGIFIGLQSGGAANAGNLLALGGALAAALYLIVGRKASRTIDPVSYNVGAFGWAAVLTGIVCVATGRPLLALSGRSFLWLVVTAVLGQTVGHGLINASLASFQPQFVALMLLWEPILGSALAFVVLGDRPVPAELVGGAIILAGLALGIIASGRSAGGVPAGVEGQEQ
jgi:drug/metabolite transporter (DMT)-like permease